MARECQLCAKKATRANYVSHAQNKVPRKQKPNLQFLSIDGFKINVCSTCRRTLQKQAVK